jgi:hypothetical protein
MSRLGPGCKTFCQPKIESSFWPWTLWFLIKADQTARLNNQNHKRFTIARPTWLIKLHCTRHSPSWRWSRKAEESSRRRLSTQGEVQKLGGRISLKADKRRLRTHPWAVIVSHAFIISGRQKKNMFTKAGVVEEFSDSLSFLLSRKILRLRLVYRVR